ncbi:SigE family RNA polymerase sigma factor [Nocardioides mesophilus]|uniref:SigE family RNA polymerase sigma factor n=1 Tax=Nocardioides mesophilus TaxID=433659 RepID=A0A7G9RER1_9ACTN|nr:SigE family RNA polymerase sigma factor [Nocardioides mesophilus]QNN54086.1 SigE family RNA polymerase sigma factor [Nocardioides mesophilus]
MRRSDRDRRFTQYVVARSPQLTRTAYLLCGDPHRAEDLVQIALTKLYLAWDRVDRSDTIDAYVRQILVRACIDESRRPWRRREVTDGQDRSGMPGKETEPQVESAVFAALRALPPGQRAAVVLRYWNDLSVEETARLIGCSRSTVKTQASRGLERLRAALAPTPSTSGAHDE